MPIRKGWKNANNCVAMKRLQPVLVDAKSLSIKVEKTSVQTQFYLSFTL